VTPLDIVLILVIALGVGFALVFFHVLIQWSLRKARPSLPPPVEAAPEVEEELAAELVIEPPPAEIAEPSAREEPIIPVALPEVAQPIPPPPPPPPPAREPVRIGLGLRKTRENFLSRIRAALTGSAKLDDIYEGLEEALIAADVGVDASMKITSAVRKKLGNDNRPDAIRDGLKAEIAAIMTSADRAPADSGGRNRAIAGMVRSRWRRDYQAIARLRSRRRRLRRGEGRRCPQNEHRSDRYRRPPPDQGQSDGGAEENCPRDRARIARRAA